MTSYTTKSAYPYPDPTDQVADYPTTAQTLANYLDNLPNRNRIINSQFNVWQRGTSFSNPATGTYTADRWIFTHNGTGGTRTISQYAVANGTTIGGMQARTGLSFAITNAGSPAATSQTIGQRIEDVRTFAGEQITFSAYVTNLAVAGITSATVKAIQNFGTGGSPSAAVTTTLGTITIGSTWSRVSLTATLPSISGKTLGTTDNNYLEIQIDVGGSTGTLYLWGVQVEQGGTRTALERVGLGDELGRCQRYYVNFAAQNSATLNVWGVAYVSANAASPHIVLPTYLRAAPTIDTSGLNIRYGGADYVATDLTGGTSRWQGSMVDFQVTSTGTANGNVAVVWGNQNSYIRITAEL